LLATTYVVAVYNLYIVLSMLMIAFSAVLLYCQPWLIHNAAGALGVLPVAWKLELEK